MPAFSPLTPLDPDQQNSAGQPNPNVPRLQLPATASHLASGQSAAQSSPTASNPDSPPGAPGSAESVDPETVKATPRRVIVKREPKPFKLDLTPSAEEQKIVNGCLQLFQGAKHYRNALLPRWNECYRMLTNRHWNPASRADWLPFPQIPEIFPIIRTLVAWQMDMRFKTSISPAALPHSDLATYFTSIAQDLEYTMDASWQANTEEREWGMITWDGMVYGCGWAKTSWERELAGGMGDAMARHVSPYRIYPDPKATSPDNWSYVIEARDLSLQELDERFPGAARAFGSTGGVSVDIDEPPSLLDLLGNRPSRLFGNPGALPPATTPNWNRPVQNPSIPNIDMPRVTVLECWLKEHTYTDVTDIATRQTRKVASTSWRVIVIANNRVLMDEPAENIWTHGGHPYSRYQPIDFNDEMWGISMVELLISPQKCLNRLLAALQHNLELTGNPIWIDEDRNVRNMPITNKPGQRVPITSGDQRTGWMTPPPINAGAQQMVDFLLKRMEVISGINAILKGNAPQGRNSSSTVDAIAESSHVGIRQMLRQLEYALRDSFRKKAALIIDNYTQPRLVSIAGEQGANTHRALRARHFLIPASDGAVPLQFQLIVDAGSRHHVSRQMRENRAVQLFAMELIDEQAALTEIDFPNAAVVAARVAERKAAAAEAEAAAKGGSAMGPGNRTGARV